eukprot:2108912-Rhodomonas_salina.1
MESRRTGTARNIHLVGPYPTSVPHTPHSIRSCSTACRIAEPISIPEHTASRYCTPHRKATGQPTSVPGIA